MKDFKSIAEKEPRHGEFKKLSEKQRQLKLNGISTGKSRMAKLLLAKLVRDLWKMEFKDMESTLGDMEVNVGLEMDGKENHGNYFETTAARKIEEQTQGKLL